MCESHLLMYGNVLAKKTKRTKRGKGQIKADYWWRDKQKVREAGIFKKLRWGKKIKVEKAVAADKRRKKWEVDKKTAEPSVLRIYRLI